MLCWQAGTSQSGGEPASVVAVSPWPWAHLHQTGDAAWREGGFKVKNRIKNTNTVTEAMAMHSAVMLLQELELLPGGVGLICSGEGKNLLL